MYTTEYTCKVITPMLIHGVDKTIPELRAPSIKGAMRFWWRAVNAFLCNEELSEREQLIFGGINNDSLKSSFSISVEVDEKKKQIKTYSPVPHKEECKFRVSGFSEKTEFTVRFSVNNKVVDKINDNGKIVWISGEDRLKEIENVFELLALCGGLGMRSRRGFGAFSIIKKKEDEFYKPVNVKHIKDLINNIRKETIAYICANNKVICPGVPAKTGLVSIQLGSCDKSFNYLLNHIGDRSHEARNIKRYNDIQQNDIGDALGYIDNGRLASPIIVSVFMTKLKNYRIIITTLCSADSSDRKTKIQIVQDKFINDLL